MPILMILLARLPAPSWAEADAARAEFETLDDVDDFLDREQGARGGGEPERTWVDRLASAA